MRLLALPAAALVLAACPPAETTDVGGPVDGAADDHCGDTVVTVDESACAEAAGEGEGEPEEEADEYGDTLFNAEGDDDECKYHLAFTATEVKLDEEVTFTVKATAKDGGAVVTGGNVRAEVFLDDAHGVTGGDTVEGPDGTYTIGPVTFDQSGRWTVRFHLFETCADGETSPHGHGAFFVDVP